MRGDTDNGKAALTTDNKGDYADNGQQTTVNGLAIRSDAVDDDNR